MSTVTQLIPTGTWTADPVHSVVGFSVRHMGIATVHGVFEKFEARLEVGDDLAHARVEANVEAASITTREAQRDEHLRSPEFFNAEAFPQITYTSTGIRVVDDETFVVAGDLQMAGVTRSVELTATVGGLETDPWGNERVGLELRGSLNRGDFGMTFNQLLGGGNMLVSDTVKIAIDISAIRSAG
ncbi:MAG: YceI family protein [Thermoleophilia bacterium]